MKIAGAFLLVCLCGCTQIAYRPYAADRQSWPVARGAPVLRQYALPVYAGPPAQPYQVIAWLRIESGWRGQWPQEHYLRRAVREAKQRGADAVILLDRRLEPGSRATRAVAIRFN